MTVLPTASRLERAIRCEASNVLPVVEREASDYAKERSTIHVFLEAVPRIGREKALAAMPPDYRELCDSIDLSALPLDAKSFAGEVAFAWDVTTGKARELGRGLGRDYGAARDTEFCGTADVVALMADGGVFVGDYKPRWSPYVPPARDNWQLRALALFAARTYERTHAVVDLIHVGADGVWFDRAEFDTFDLDQFEDELRFFAALFVATREAVKGGRITPQTEGSWCRFCPSFSYCPAKTRLAASLALVPMDGGKTFVQLSREKAGEARAKVKAARQVLERDACRPGRETDRADRLASRKARPRATRASRRGRLHGQQDSPSAVRR